MADEEPDAPPPSLELPTLGWRRRRKERRAAAPAEEAVAAPVEPASEPTTALPVVVEDPEPVVVAEEPAAEEPVVEEPAPEPPKRRRERGPRKPRGPRGLPTVVVVGVLVGLVVVGLTWASLQSCEEVQGTPSCGRAGYPMLALVLGLAVLVGGVLLRLARVPDPVSTSILGVGLATVVALLVLVDHLDEPAMVVVVPVVCAITFAAAHWLTRSFIEPGDRPR